MTTVIRLFILLACLLSPPAGIDLELFEATLGEAASALAARGVPAVCVSDDGRRASVRFTGLGPAEAARFVAGAFEAPLRQAGETFALGGGTTGSVLLAVERGGALRHELAEAGRTLEVTFPGGATVRIVPLLFGNER